MKVATMVLIKESKTLVRNMIPDVPIKPTATYLFWSSRALRGWEHRTIRPGQAKAGDSVSRAGSTWTGSA
jgi:hypothetical protein